MMTNLEMLQFYNHTPMGNVRASCFIIDKVSIDFQLFIILFFLLESALCNPGLALCNYVIL
jgi:hypothetical protein